jgi:hypothetical protein
MGSPDFISELEVLGLPRDKATITGKVDLLMETDQNFIVRIGGMASPLTRNRFGELDIIDLISF